MNKVCGIYLIRNTKNNHLYVGQSVNIYKRWASHRQLLSLGKHPSIHLQRAWNLYGKEAFEFCIVDRCERNSQVLTEMEQYWMDLVQPEYNTCPAAGSTLGIKLSETTKQKMSQSLKGKPKSQAMRDALKKYWKHNKEERLAAREPVTEQTKEKMSQAHSGEKHHFYGLTGEQNPNFGKKRSEDFSQKMSELHKGEIKSEEHKKKISDSLKGIPLSEERKEAMRKAPRPKQTPEQIAKRVAATKATKEAKLNK